MTEPFAGFDLSDFWEDSEYATQTYVDGPATAEMVALVEKELGYRLPAAYIALMRTQNGGTPTRTCHRTRERTTWAENHVAINAIYAIGKEPACSLLGAHGSRFWSEEWGYPQIGIYFADCPSAGHDMLCLDYRRCGPTGEPEVVHVDQEWDYRVTHVAANFEMFVRGLESCEDVEND